MLDSDPTFQVILVSVFIIRISQSLYESAGYFCCGKGRGCQSDRIGSMGLGVLLFEKFQDRCPRVSGSRGPGDLISSTSLVLTLASELGDWKLKVVSQTGKRRSI